MSKSLEALDELCDMATPDGDCLNYVIGLSATIKQDLERLEVLEKEKQELIKEKNATIILMRLMALDPNNIVESALILDKYKKALDKACERLNWDCPVSQDIIDDLDCENRCSSDFEEVCKECWKKYFLNLADVEVLE